MSKIPDPKAPTATAWMVWLLAALAFGYAFFQRVSPSVMVDELMAEFSIGAAVLGTLSALYFYPYVLLQIPLGVLIDRWGARLLMALALSIAGLGSVIFAFADGIALAYAGRLLIGIGSAVGFLGSLALAANWFPPHRFAMLAGLTMFFGLMSGVFAQGPLSGVISQFGWRATMFGMGFAGIALALTIFVVVRDNPLNSEQHAKPKQGLRSMFNGIKQAGSSFQVWKIAIIASTMSGPMLALGALWAIPYMIATYDLPKAVASGLVSSLFVGWAFSAPLVGWISDRLKMRKPLLIAGSTTLTLLLGLFVLVPDLSLWVSVALLVAMGIAGSFMTICFALVRETSHSEISSSVTGIVNSLTVASGALLQPVIGLILDYSWDGQVVEGSRVYASSDYRIAFSSVLVACVIGTAFSLTVRETEIWDKR